MRTRNIILLFLILDLVIISFLILVISGLHYQLSQVDYFPSTIRLIIYFNLAWIISTLIYIDDMRNLKLGISKAFGIQLKKIVVFIALVSLIIISGKVDYFSRTIFFSAIGLFTIIKMSISLWFYYEYKINDKVNKRPTLIIGNTKIANDLFGYFSKCNYLKLSPIGILDETLGANPANKIIGKISDFEQLYEKFVFQDVIITIPLTEIKDIEYIIFTAEKNGIRVHVVPNYDGVIHRTFKMNTFGRIQMLDLRFVPLDTYSNYFWKRAFDLVLSVIMLVLLSPVFLIIALLIKLTNNGPIFYKPKRLGMNGLPFTVYKFRSMYHNDKTVSGGKSTVLNDVRITKVGKYLRKFNLDELPQLLNVINNEMSLVGPRPHRVHLNFTLKQKMNSYLARHWIRPGITGWAQVNGWRGPTENKLQYKARTLHDLWYIENWSFWLDIYIMFLTIFSKKTNKNAF